MQEKDEENFSEIFAKLTIEKRVKFMAEFLEKIHKRPRFKYGIYFRAGENGEIEKLLGVNPRLNIVEKILLGNKTIPRLAYPIRSQGWQEVRKVLIDSFLEFNPNHEIWNSNRLKLIFEAEAEDAWEEFKKLTT